MTLFENNSMAEDEILEGGWTRRSFVKFATALGVASVIAGFGPVKPAIAETTSRLSWPVPAGALDDKIDGKTVLKCYAPSTTATFTEVLGLNNPSFFANEYNVYTASPYNLTKSPTLGIWGSPANAQCNAFLSNLIYRDYYGGTVDDNYVAVLGSALQGYGQGATMDDEDGVPLFMKHRPHICAVSDAGQGTWLAPSEYAKIINNFTEGDGHYQAGDENYNPRFVDMRAAYGKKLGYMYDMWEVAKVADEMLAKDSSLTTRYSSPDDQAALVEMFMLSSQYAVMRGINTGATKRKVVGVIGGLADQYQEFNSGVNLETGRVRLDAFERNNLSYDGSTQWGLNVRTQVRYYHPSAALENCCDSIIEVLGYSDATAENYDENAEIIKDENGVFWAKPSAIMKCDKLVFRTSTTVSEIPGTDALYKLLNRAGYADKNSWPDIHTVPPQMTSGGGWGGASNCAQLFWWFSYLFFVYPEIINPVHMAAYLITEIMHIASSSIGDAMDIIVGDMSLPNGYSFSWTDYNPKTVAATLTKGTEWYLANKSAVDESYPNLQMTEHMFAYLDDAKRSEMGIKPSLFMPTRIVGADNYAAACEGISAAFKKASTVVIVNGSKLADSLIATPLAKLYNAPVIPVAKGSLPASASALIKKLGAKKYIIVGAKSSVAAAVETALKKLGLKAAMSRVTASNAPALSVKAYNAAVAKKKKWAKTAILVSTKNVPAAIAVASYAYAKKMPVFFISGKLTAATKKALKKFTKVIVIGRTTDISAAVVKKVPSKSKVRWSGSNAANTTLAVVKKELAGSMAANRCYFVNGAKVDPAVAAVGAVAGKLKKAIVPVTASTAANLAAPIKAKKPATVFVYGNPSSVPAATFEKLIDALS